MFCITLHGCIVRRMCPILQTFCLIVPCVLIFHQPPPCALYHEERICAVKQIVRRAALILVLLCCAAGLQRVKYSITNTGCSASCSVLQFSIIPVFHLSTERIHRQTVSLFPTPPIGQNALPVLFIDSAANRQDTYIHSVTAANFQE